MKAVALLAAVSAVLSSATVGVAGNTPRLSAKTYKCTDSPSKLRSACGGVKPDIVVCIDDFMYQPPVITPRVGQTVAWVNVEKCADKSGSPVNLVEGLVAETLGAGCDTHHEVVTFPDESSFNPEDTVDLDICSPYPGIPANPSLPPLPGFAIDASSCQFPETNVACHTFENVGLQHYTCFTNPGHAAVLHGGILVIP